MTTRQHHPHPASEQNALDLLEALIEAPPTPTERRRKPVALRSATEQRQHALRGFMLRTWVDSLLHNAERLVFLATVLVFGYWLLDGPVRDWLHEQQQPAITAPVAAAAPAAPQQLAARPPARAQSAAAAAPLPYTTPDSQGAQPADDFMAPRQRPIDAPVAVVLQPTHLAIPAIGVDSPVKEVFVVDGAWEVADYAAGYLHGTGLPGDPGNAVLAGHAGLRGGVFRDLGALAVGNDIYVDAAGWQHHYRVREIKSVWPTQVEVLDQTSTSVLTLLTCTNWDTQRLVVVADLVDSKPSPGP